MNSIPTLAPAQLRHTIDPLSLGFASTAELVDQALPWIGQERAAQAAHFGLSMDQPDYNLFVLGEVGSGRASLMRQAMQQAAAARPVPPDLCYLHDFEAPERPRALRLPAGQGRLLRQNLQEWCKSLETDIPKRLAAADVRAEAERIAKAYQSAEAQAFSALGKFAQERNFRLTRDDGQMVFTLLGPGAHPITDAQAQALSPEQRHAIQEGEQALRAEIVRFLDQTRPLERTRDAALAALRRQTAKPLVEHGLDDIRQSLRKQIKDGAKLGHWLDQIQREVLENLDLFIPAEGLASSEEEEDPAEEDRRADLADLLARCHVNLAVDNAVLQGAPVIVEDNPQLRSLFGHIEHDSNSDAPGPDFSCVRAGSLLRAHGGYLMLYLRDFLGDELLWERLRRFLRSSRIAIEDVNAGHGQSAGSALQPEAVDVDVKIVLIGGTAEYYALQEGDAEVARRFRAKVDFADRFRATEATRQATAIFVAHACARRGLPHFTPAAVARLIEESHREAEDQQRQSALFAATESLLIEAGALARARSAAWTDAPDVANALLARRLRHDAPEEDLHDSIADGERLISLTGAQMGQLNALTQIDLGDYRFGFPVRITARTFAGQEGLMNIEREVDLSGPIHDKGVLILHSYLTALFAHVAPLALDASIVFEQEYSGIEGDSASCAELYALLSSLAGVPLRQDIAVTGALNQHGEVLPVGGLNEKIEGWFRTCQATGLTGTQGVLIPARNQRHLMLDPQVLEAVEQGLFHVYTAEHVRQGVALLCGQPLDGTPEQPGVAQLAERTLRAFRRACQSASPHAVAGRRGPRLR
jgi:predicted ATP-dependent protease